MLYLYRNKYDAHKLNSSIHEDEQNDALRRLRGEVRLDKTCVCVCVCVCVLR